MKYKSWEALNRERGALIDKKLSGAITPEEAARLDVLQEDAARHLERFRVAGLDPILARGSVR